MTEVYRTGNVYANPKIWVEDRRAKKYVWFRLLRWSEDLENEKGVMFKTDVVVKVFIKRMPGASDFFYKKPYGDFRLRSEPITIK